MPAKKKRRPKPDLSSIVESFRRMGEAPPALPGYRPGEEDTWLRASHLLGQVVFGELPGVSFEERQAKANATAARYAELTGRLCAAVAGRGILPQAMHEVFRLLWNTTRHRVEGLTPDQYDAFREAAGRAFDAALLRAEAELACLGAAPASSGAKAGGLTLRMGTLEIWYDGVPVVLKNRPAAAFGFILSLAEKWPARASHTEIETSVGDASQQLKAEGRRATVWERNEARKVLRRAFIDAGLEAEFKRLVVNHARSGYSLHCKSKPVILP